MKNEPGSSPRGAPLMCWDIFMDGYQKKIQLAEDICTLNKLSIKQKWQHSFDFETELFRSGNTILVTDPKQHIIYASSSIFLMNGYLPGEIIGKRPFIFQGTNTCPQIKASIRQSINDRSVFEQTIVNYCKNGAPYNCHIKGFPVFNHKKELANFIAFETAI